MHITDIKTFLAHPGRGKNLCFVKIETDEGIYGWGECYTQADRDLQITAHVDALKRYLIGRDPTNIKHFTQMVYDDFAGSNLVGYEVRKNFDRARHPKTRITSDESECFFGPKVAPNDRTRT